jgi:hypothetical protein
MRLAPSWAFVLCFGFGFEWRFVGVVGVASRISTASSSCVDSGSTIAGGAASAGAA